MGNALSSNQFVVEGRTVLITGGSRGLGLNAGRQLAERGASVIIAARDASVLQEAISFISQGSKCPQTQRFHTIQGDVTTSSECARIVSEATKWNNNTPPDIVWCCSGSAHPSLFIDTPVEQLQTMMDSNYFSSAYMAHAVLNRWLRPSSSSPSTSSNIVTSHESNTRETEKRPPTRHLIFTGSFVSFYSFAGFTPYSPSKAATRALSDSLSQEMNLYNTSAPVSQPYVKLHTVFPATMPTQSLIDENKVKTDLTLSLEEGDTILEPDEVARRAIRGLERGEELVATSFIIRLVKCSVLGGCVRGGFWRGVVDTLLSWVVVVVMVFIRSDMDSKVGKWGRMYGTTGMKDGKLKGSSSQ